MDAEGKLTGIVDCSSLDSPMDAISDVCVSDGIVYISGMSYAPDSDFIERECVVAYNRDGAMRSVVFELDDMTAVNPTIKSLSDAPGGVVIAYERSVIINFGSKEGGKSGLGFSGSEAANSIVLVAANKDGLREITSVDSSSSIFYDFAFSGGNRDRYAAITISGGIRYPQASRGYKFYDGHVFVGIDLDDGGDVLYGCDDMSGALCVIDSGSDEVRSLVPGTGFDSVHVNGDTISLSDSKSGVVKLCDLSGAVKLELDVVEQSAGYSARLLLVWVSGLYLIVLVVVSAIRTLRRNREPLARTEAMQLAANST